MNKKRYELQAEADNGTWDTWDYEYTKKSAIKWFNDITKQYPDSKFRVIKCKLKIIANCTITKKVK